MITGIDPPDTLPRKISRELKPRIAELFDRYAFEEVMNEIAKQKPKFDIYICPAKQKRVCLRCGAEQP